MKNIEDSSQHYSLIEALAVSSIASIMMNLPQHHLSTGPHNQQLNLTALLWLIFGSFYHYSCFIFLLESCLLMLVVDYLQIIIWMNK